MEGFGDYREARERLPPHYKLLALSQSSQSRQLSQSSQSRQLSQSSQFRGLPQSQGEAGPTSAPIMFVHLLCATMAHSGNS